MKQKIVQTAPGQAKKPTPNRTGIPTQMKLDFEHRSGLSFDDVRVHYHSDKPARIGALAYTCGNQVHVGPGQERHLKHELGHVIQQKLGVVKPTTKINNIPINDDPSLEHLASSTWIQTVVHTPSNIGSPVVQCVPSITQVAKKRFIDICKSLLASPNIAKLSSALQLISDQAQTQYPGNAADQEDAILRILLQTGLPRDLAQIMCYQLVQGNIPQARMQFIGYYDGFNGQMGIDRGQIDPRQNSPRQLKLVHLQTKLKRRILPLVRRASLASRPGNLASFQSPFRRNLLHRISYLNNLNRLNPQLQQAIRRGATITNTLIRPNSRNLNYGMPVIPNTINLDSTGFGGITSDSIQPIRGTQRYGLGVGPSQVVHENFHLVENNLLVDDFANLHRFLRMRTDDSVPDRPAGWGSAPTGGTGYNAELPPMAFQNAISRSMHSYHSMFLFGLHNAGNAVLSLLTPDPRGQQYIDDFFLQESNSETTNYATLYREDGGYATEFLSTTGELFSTERGVTELINSDPTRAAMFIYLTNRPLFMELNRSFQWTQPGPDIQTLKQFLHLI